MSQRRLLVALLMVCVLVSGCKRDLFGQLTEQDANEMLVGLLQDDIQAEKESKDGGKTWTITVDEDRLVEAMASLKSRGLPQSKFASLGEIFKKEGLVSTPSEERVRFLYGVTQELSNTLSQIDGVLTARVHIVLPNNDPLASSVKPSSASVFIRFQPSANIDSLVPGIKNLVVHGVEGLAYENVTVTLLPADRSAKSRRAAPVSFMQGKTFLAMVGAAVLLLIAGAAFAARVRLRALVQPVQPVPPAQAAPKK